MTAARSISAPLARQDWPDIAKGLGILLVVFGHAWRGLEAAGILAGGPLFHAVDRAIYAFHIPLFFFLSGWFFPQLLLRCSQKDLIGRQFWHILYPMVIWTYVFLGVKFLAGDAPNVPASLSDMARWPVPGYLHLWFLWALFLLQGIVILLRPLALRGLVAFFAVMTVLSFGKSGVDLPDAALWVQSAIRFAPWFFLGGIWGLTGQIPASHRAAIVAVLTFALAEAAAIFHPGSGLVPRLLITGTAVVSIFVLIRAAEPLAGGCAEIFALLGRFSMTIYLMHTIFSAATRILLDKGLGIEAVGPHLLFSVLAGIALPLMMHLPAVPSMLRRVLGLPDRVLPLRPLMTKET